MIELLFSISVGVLSMCGVYLMLRARTFPVVLGLTLLSYAVNLFLFGSGRLIPGNPPLIADGVERYVDPLPQALVLTSIVIGLGVLALMVALCVRLYERYGTFDVTEIRRLRG